MTPSSRICAAIEVLGDIEARHRPASDVLKDWGLSHRFAGSGDRAAIASLVYDALRRRSSARFVVDADSARATVIGMLHLQRKIPIDGLASLFSLERFSAPPLTDSERHALQTRRLEDAPPFIQADVPEWLWPLIVEMFCDTAILEGQALAERAPLDLRVNTLKTSREDLLRELNPLRAGPTPHSPVGLRIPFSDGGRSVPVQSEPSFQKGWFEVQDEASQIVTFLTLARPGEQVLDLCAGSGGKTLALAAAMGNTGQIYATDNSIHRLAPIHKRLEAAGVRNVQVKTPRGGLPLAEFDGAMDLVLIDAPCTGSGTWRRNPDSKWRLRPTSLIQREEEQARALMAGARAVKPGGRLVYVTCSILPSENDWRVNKFLTHNPDFKSVPPSDAAVAAGLGKLGNCPSPRNYGLMLTPYRTGTDGFYIAVTRRER